MAESFLGNKISLISKKGIRYEGILRAVDSNQSTMTLSEVVSFGTENRVCDSHVPPCSNVYEYIIFRGSDILDLHICRQYTPPTPQVHYWNTDPVLVTMPQETILPQPNLALQSKSYENPDLILMKSPVSSLNYSTSFNPPAVSSTAFFERASGSILSQEQEESLPNTQHVTSTSHSGPLGSTSNEIEKPTSVSQPMPLFSPEELSKTTLRDAVKSFPNSRTGHSYTGKQEDATPFSHSGTYASVAAGVNAGAAINPRSMRSYDNYAPSNVRRDQDQVNKYRYGSSARGSGGYNSGEYLGRHHAPRNRGRGGPFMTNTPRNADFRNDYDFEAANAKIADELAKLRIPQGNVECLIQEVRPLEDPSPEPQVADESLNASGDHVEPDDSAKFYDKKKSFFDCISCESTDRSSENIPRVNWNEEKRTNSETFGRYYRGGSGGFGMSNYSRGNSSYIGRGSIQRSRIYTNNHNHPRRPTYVTHY